MHGPTRSMLQTSGVIAALSLAVTLAFCPAGVAATVAELAGAVQAEPMAEAFERGLGAWNVRLSDDGKSIVLYDHALIEDDGPGISSDLKWLITDRAPTTRVGGDLLIKKILHVERPQALAARLYGTKGFDVTVNGKPVETPGNSEYPAIPPELLRQGDNEIVLSYAGKDGRTVKMARYEDIYRNAPQRRDTPRRSFVSTDGGKSWKDAGGEHMVRLHLVQYVRQGSLISPTIDLGREAAGNPSPILTPVTIASVALKAEAETPYGTSVKLDARTGPCPVYDKELWSDWQTANAVKTPGNHRYLQWRATLSSHNPLKTPLLKDVAVKADVKAGPRADWLRRVTVIGHHNEEIRYTSIPFEYENPNHPRMVALRKKYKLDEVVAGARSELEKMVKLRNWVAHQWRFTAPKENYPAWDADEILSRKYGFCVQYAIVFMQCATSLGIQTRFVFGNNPGAIDGGGHEVCEWWSNEYGKWVFFDCNQNWFQMNPGTEEPYSLLEIHDAVIKEYYGGGIAEWSKRPREHRYSPEFACCYGLSLEPNEPADERQKKAHLKDGLYRVPARWLNLRYMPRNNFLSRPYPVPMLQGAHWDWTDYIIYKDAHTPREWQYRNFTARQSDIAWTINQVHFDAACGVEPGSVQIQMGTSTPYFETFLTRIGDGRCTRSGRTFTWKLKPGRNRLEMRVENTSGVRGPVSYLELQYQP